MAFLTSILYPRRLLAILATGVRSQQHLSVFHQAIRWNFFLRACRSVSPHSEKEQTAVKNVSRWWKWRQLKRQGFLHWIQGTWVHILLGAWLFLYHSILIRGLNASSWHLPDFIFAKRSRRSLGKNEVSVRLWLRRNCGKTECLIRRKSKRQKLATGPGTEKISELLPKYKLAKERKSERIGRSEKSHSFISFLTDDGNEFCFWCGGRIRTHDLQNQGSCRTIGQHTTDR